MSHVINNTTDESIVLSRLLEQTKQFKNIFSNMKESSNIMLNEPSKMNHHKNSNKRKKSIFEYKKLIKAITKQRKEKRKLVDFVLLLAI